MFFFFFKPRIPGFGALLVAGLQWLCHCDFGVVKKSWENYGKLSTSFKKNKHFCERFPTLKIPISLYTHFGAAAGILVFESL